VSVRFLEEAAHEFHRAIQYYEEKSPGLGGELLSDVERLENLLSSNPELGSPGKSGTRRLLLRRFPFLLVYILVDREPLIVAFAHQRREPGYWSDRT
jgi:hypothetical protein